MHILPPLETVKDIAATQQYDVLPLSCEILSDFITPIEAMRILKNVSTHCYMLESAQADDRWGRYTFLGFDPKLEITCIDGKMKAGGLTVRTDDPSQYLRELLSSYRSPRFDYLPSFTGGLVGYFSYDYLKYSEPSVRCGEQDEDSFKDVDLMLFDKVIAFDHVRQKIVLIVNRQSLSLSSSSRSSKPAKRSRKRRGGSSAKSRRSSPKSSSARWSKPPSTTSARAISFRSYSRTA